MKRESISAQQRTVTGKKVRHLRREGLIPANIFGKGFDSISIQLPLKDFVSLYKKVHETGLVDLTIDGHKYPTLIQHVQIHPITHTPVHADFFKVNLKEKVKANIPIVAVDEAKAVTDKVGVLLQQLSEVEIEALPADLPEHIEATVEKLAQIDDSITVGDLDVPKDVEILADSQEIVFKIGELVSEEAEELAEEEAAQAEAASEETAAENESEQQETQENSEEQKTD